LLLGLGLLERGSIGVWSLAPPHEASELAWQFDTAETLRSELERAWKETVAPQSRLPRLARAKFKEGEFAAAIAAYDELPAARLARSDALRVDIALRRMQDPG
jgi:hypothetical protein